MNSLTSLIPRWGHHDRWWRRVSKSRGSQRAGRRFSAWTLLGLQLHEQHEHGQVQKQANNQLKITIFIILPIYNAVPQLMVRNPSHWRKHRHQSKHQGCFAAGHNTLLFTKASIRERDSSSKTCSRATRWGTVVFVIFLLDEPLLYMWFSWSGPSEPSEEISFFVVFFCRCQFFQKSTKRTPSVWVGVQSILIMLCCLPVCYTLGIQMRTHTHARAHSHARSHPLLYVQLLLLTAKSSLNQFTLFPSHCYLLLSSLWCCSVFSAVSP